MPFKETVDESIVAFATVREQVVSSQPEFGDWRIDRPKQKQYGADVVPCVVEVTRGSPNKYEVDKATGMLQLDRVLHSAVHYPGDYGYIPATLCGDGDPLDLLIISPYSAQEYKGLEPGIVANCRIVGLMDMEDESGRDEKIIAVLAEHRSCSQITTLDTVPPHLRKEIQHFFENYKVLEKKGGKPKWAKILGWGDKEAALKCLSASRQAYESKKLQDSLVPQRFKQLWAPNMLHAPQNVMSNNVLTYINVGRGGTASYAYRHDTSFRHYRYSLDIPYPCDNGWLCQTWQRQVNKPLEMQVITAFPLVGECLVHTKIIGALKREYDNLNGKRTYDYKMIGATYDDPRTTQLFTLNKINPAIIEHYIRFFQHSAQVVGYKNVEITQRLEAEEAIDLFRKHHEHYVEDFPDKKIYNAPNLWCLPWGADLTSEVDNAKPEITAIIECPKGSCNKYEFRKDLGHLTLERPLYSATHWPGNYGFIPQTVAEDGRPVNILVLSNHPLKEMSLCVVRIVGALMCSDEKGPDLKVIAVPKKEPRMREWSDVEHVPHHIKSEMENFFNSYKALESEWRFCKVQKWINRADTMTVCFFIFLFVSLNSAF